MAYQRQWLQTMVHSFVSEEFATFMTKNGICHIQTAPKHPSSNGLAERAVQTVKAGMKKGTDPDFEKKLQKFLLTYRVTPQETTGKTPSELMFKRRSPHETWQLAARSQQVGQTKASINEADRRSRKQGKSLPSRWSCNGQELLCKAQHGFTGRVSEVINPVMYNVHLKDGRVVRRHIDQMRRYHTYNLTPKRGTVLTHHQ